MSESNRFGLPKPAGWPIERIVPLLAGAVIVGTLALGRAKDPRWRLMTTLVGTNLLLQGVTGWCPASGAMFKLGIRSASCPAR
ncbi:MAG: YgaP family membrane protein [Solirubrobacteraceae bacterium]